jgi:hypothetical protein
MNLPLAMFDNVLDVLRNEKPVHFRFNLGRALLETSHERVGENECGDVPADLPNTPGSTDRGIGTKSPFTAESTCASGSTCPDCGSIIFNALLSRNCAYRAAATEETQEPKGRQGGC